MVIQFLIRKMSIKTMNLASCRGTLAQRANTCFIKSSSSDEALLWAEVSFLCLWQLNHVTFLQNSLRNAI